MDLSPFFRAASPFSIRSFETKMASGSFDRPIDAIGEQHPIDVEATQGFIQNDRPNDDGNDCLDLIVKIGFHAQINPEFAGEKRKSATLGKIVRESPVAEGVVVRHPRRNMHVAVDDDVGDPRGVDAPVRLALWRLFLLRFEQLGGHGIDYNASARLISTETPYAVDSIQPMISGLVGNGFGTWSAITIFGILRSRPAPYSSAKQSTNAAFAGTEFEFEGMPKRLFCWSGRRSSNADAGSSNSGCQDAHANTLA